MKIIGTCPECGYVKFESFEDAPEPIFACVGCTEKFDVTELLLSSKDDAYPVTQASFKVGVQCLIDNGINPDEAEIVLQALCYVLIGEETAQFMQQ